MTDSTRVQLSPRVTAPTRARLRTEPGLGPISALSIALDSRGSCWRLRVHAELAPASTWRLGELLVLSPLTPSEGTRIVGLACCPGAVGWVVDVLPYYTAPPYDVRDLTEAGYLEIAAADLGMLEPGIHPVGRVELVGSRRRYLANPLVAGNTDVAMTAAQRLVKVSAWQVGTGGVIRAGGSAWTVPLPPNGAASVEHDGFGIGAQTVQFLGFPAGGGGYVIEFQE